jgi:hypothetical protein
MLLSRTAEDKKRTSALETRLGELEADAAALAVGERGVLLAAPLRDAEEERAALGVCLAVAREALGRAEAEAACEARARLQAAAGSARRNNEGEGCRRRREGRRPREVGEEESGEEVPLTSGPHISDGPAQHFSTSRVRNHSAKPAEGVKWMVSQS